jgi:hypothetical protein
VYGFVTCWIFCLFVNSYFNSAVCGLDYVALDDKMIGECWIGKNLQESGPVLVWVLEQLWKACFEAEILTRYLIWKRSSVYSTTLSEYWFYLYCCDEIFIVWKKYAINTKPYSLSSQHPQSTHIISQLTRFFTLKTVIYEIINGHNPNFRQNIIIQATFLLNNISLI